MLLADCAATPPAVMSASAQQLSQVLVTDPTAFGTVPGRVVLVGSLAVLTYATENGVGGLFA